MILAISGKKQAGKSTAFDFIKSKYHNAKEYALADKLKTICIDTLGLSHNQCYGSDLEKNTLTSLKWEQMPEIAKMLLNHAPIDIQVNKSGFMTGREVMQFVGTDIFRKIDAEVWVKACFDQIKTDQPEIAVISDVRFPNEVESVNKYGGKVIRLSRNVFNDYHQSETALDDYDRSKYWAYIDNQNMSLSKYLVELDKVLVNSF